MRLKNWIAVVFVLMALLFAGQAFGGVINVQEDDEKALAALAVETAARQQQDNSHSALIQTNAVAASNALAAAQAAQQTANAANDAVALKLNISSSSFSESNRTIHIALYGQSNAGKPALDSMYPDFVDEGITNTRLNEVIYQSDLDVLVDTSGFVKPYGGGYSVEVPIALAMVQNGFSKVLFTKVSRGGVSSANFIPGTTAYTQLVAQISETMSTQSANPPDVLIILQGETTGGESSATFFSNWTNTISSLRSQFTNDAMRVIFANFNDGSHAIGSDYYNAVEALCAADPYARSIDTKGCELNSDNIHFSGLGIMKVGNRMAGIIPALLGDMVDQPSGSFDGLTARQFGANKMSAGTASIGEATIGSINGGVRINGVEFPAVIDDTVASIGIVPRGEAQSCGNQAPLYKTSTYGDVYEWTTSGLVITTNPSAQVLPHNYDSAAATVNVSNRTYYMDFTTGAEVVDGRALYAGFTSQYGNETFHLYGTAQMKLRPEMSGNPQFTISRAPAVSARNKMAISFDVQNSTIRTCINGVWTTNTFATLTNNFTSSSCWPVIGQAAFPALSSSVWREISVIPKVITESEYAMLDLYGVDSPVTYSIVSNAVNVLLGGRLGRGITHPSYCRWTFANFTNQTVTTTGTPLFSKDAGCVAVNRGNAAGTTTTGANSIYVGETGSYRASVNLEVFPNEDVFGTLTFRLYTGASYVDVPAYLAASGTVSKVSFSRITDAKQGTEFKLFKLLGTGTKSLAFRGDFVVEQESFFGK